MPYDDHYYMGEALKLAVQAGEEGEIPVGAVVVCRQMIIARGYNQTQTLNDVTAHAEMLAITAAANHLGAKYLNDCTLYVTLEPCVMCAGAIFWAQLARVVYAAGDVKRGFSTVQPSILHPKTVLEKELRADEAQTLLLNFFKKLRT